jgi:hypothetical protein
VVLWSDFKRNAAVNTSWPLHKTSALDDLKADCIRRGLWREEGNHIRRGPFPPPAPSVEVRELSVEEDGDGRTYLKIEPLHAPAVVYETGDTDPTPSSSPVPTPARFEATALRYRFLAHDPADITRISPVREWTARMRLKYQLHNRGDHYEIELRALPRANGIAIRYTTDGSAPTHVGATTYDGVIRVPAGCRTVLAIAVAPALGLNSEVLRVPIPQPGAEGPKLDPKVPVRWMQRIKLDDAGAVWDFVRRIDETATVTAYDLELTAESNDGLQHVDYFGAVESGYTAASIKAAADQMQAMVGTGGLRMVVGSLGFQTGQALLDWLKATGQPFDMAKISQSAQ